MAVKTRGHEAISASSGERESRFFDVRRLRPKGHGPKQVPHGTDSRLQSQPKTGAEAQPPREQVVTEWCSKNTGLKFWYVTCTCSNKSGTAQVKSRTAAYLPSHGAEAVADD